MTDREKQIAEAEEMLADGLAKAGYAKRMFYGRVPERRLVYPDLAADEETCQAVERLRDFCSDRIDPVKIDRDALIPDDVVRGLGQLGVLGACLPQQFGGLGYSQTAYCRLIEVLGGHCGSTALFVNAHHSIGPRALVLFGTAEQQRKYLPKLATGEWLSAFALTEPQAGSDAGNVQTQAVPTADGGGYVLNGEKRWITNGGIAQALTVMARTPVPGSKDTKVTAFIVTPDMPGFQVVEARMPKCGVRGTATAKLAFHDMRVPRENVLGELGKGLRIALTVLDYGRVTFGASCTGAAKTCLEATRRHALTRVQFGETLSSFELVQEKLAWMAAQTFAMEACTYQTAAMIDSGSDDYMVETAMLKVFSTDALWRIVNDCFQVHGGMAYFSDQPYERMMRDARINMIGEGANDVLRVFIALAGMRDVGLELKGALEALQSPAGNIGKLGRFASRRLGGFFAAPRFEMLHNELDEDAAAVARLIRRLGRQIERLLATHQESVLDRQLQLARIADAATELYVSSCVLARLDRALTVRRSPSAGHGNHSPAHNGGHGHTPAPATVPQPSHASEDDESQRRQELSLGRYYLRTAARRIRRNFADLRDNDDDATIAAAKMVLH